MVSQIGGRGRRRSLGRVVGRGREDIGGDRGQLLHFRIALRRGRVAGSVVLGAVVLLVPVLGGVFDGLLEIGLSELRSAGQEPDSVLDVLGILVQVSVAEVIGVDESRAGSGLAGILIGLQLLGIRVDFVPGVLLRHIVGAYGAVEGGGGEIFDFVVVGLAHAGIFGGGEALLGCGGGVIEHLLLIGSIGRLVGLHVSQVHDGEHRAQVIGIGLDEALGSVEHFGRVARGLVSGHQGLEHLGFGDAVGILRKEGLDGRCLSRRIRLAGGVGVGVIFSCIFDGDLGAVGTAALASGLTVGALGKGRQRDRAGTQGGQRNRGNRKLLHSTLLGRFHVFQTSELRRPAPNQIRRNHPVIGEPLRRCRIIKTNSAN